jgi:uncharacterized protein (DUF952 family)
VPNEITPHRTLHLCPAEVWESQKNAESYLPEAYGQDGFIHCTDGDERLVNVGNMFYASDPRIFIVLTVDLGANGERWIYEDADQVFPHIYGPIHSSSVIAVRPAQRDDDGTFTGIGDMIS